ncbi:MAG: GTPase HflX [Nitrososphaerota archaeon]|nr:GTPase HflX [Nitrososphaerales archaeon]MCX8192107.1 GTPase HflX [Nitrososphaerales archaeon]MDW8044420.1 GTPase HflX [Nitrososphaerota archaeon]
MQKRRSILITYPDQYIIEEALGLADAAGYEVVEVIKQRYLKRAKFGIGPGKAEELKRLVKDLNVDAILFDERLRSVQIYNLTKLTGVEVIDREKLILEIFNRRATTAEAKIQVKMAELRYEMPRAKEKVRLAKMGEQPGFFGLGKYEVDVYYYTIKKRISMLKEKLKEIGRMRVLHRIQRQKLNIPIIALAGYTGVGKTTLFNLLTGEKKEVDKGAFTTLSTYTRATNLFNSKVLISDTVGFISRLPTYMIESFKSTLEELTYANLVLLMLDLSKPSTKLAKEYEDCMKILSELKVSPSRILLVFNKADLVAKEGWDEKLRVIGFEGNYVVISAKTGMGIDELKERIYNSIFKSVRLELTLSQEEALNLAEEIDWLKQNAVVKTLTSDYNLTLIVDGPSWTIDHFQSSYENLVKKRVVKT